MCIRFGARYNVECLPLKSSQGGLLMWTDRCRYLGVHFVSGRLFKCTFDCSKTQFFKAFNAVLSKVGRFASEDVVLSLLSTKCLPILLYGVEACPMRAHDKHSLEFTVTRSLMKLFRTRSTAIITECQKFFSFLPVKYKIDIRTVKFLEQFVLSENCVCSVFVSKAESSIKQILSAYGTNISTSSELRNVLNNLFFNS